MKKKTLGFITRFLDYVDNLRHFKRKKPILPKVPDFLIKHDKINVVPWWKEKKNFTFRTFNLSKATIVIIHFVELEEK